jgi:hypothetical protein
MEVRLPNQGIDISASHFKEVDPIDKQAPNIASPITLSFFPLFLSFLPRPSSVSRGVQLGLFAILATAAGDEQRMFLRCRRVMTRIVMRDLHILGFSLSTFWFIFELCIPHRLASRDRLLQWSNHDGCLGRRPSSGSSRTGHHRSLRVAHIISGIGTRGNSCAASLQGFVEV